MNTARNCLIAAIATILLSACATSGSAGLASKPAFHTDEAYVAAVEQKARMVGVRVVWINPPRRRDGD